MSLYAHTVKDWRFHRVRVSQAHSPWSCQLANTPTKSFPTTLCGVTPGWRPRNACIMTSCPTGRRMRITKWSISDCLSVTTCRRRRGTRNDFRSVTFLFFFFFYFFSYWPAIVDWEGRAGQWKEKEKEKEKDCRACRYIFLSLIFMGRHRQEKEINPPQIKIRVKENKLRQEPERPSQFPIVWPWSQRRERDKELTHGQTKKKLSAAQVSFSFLSFFSVQDCALAHRYAATTVDPGLEGKKIKKRKRLCSKSLNPWIGP